MNTQKSLLRVLPIYVLLLVSFPALSQQTPDRNACGFSPQNVEQLTTDPAIQEIYRQMDEKIGELSRKSREKKTSRSASPGIVYKVPVVVHLIYEPGTALGEYANMTDAQVQSLINQANANLRHASGSTYANPFSGADAGIELCLATEDPFGNPINGIDRHEDAVNATYNPATQNVQNAYQWPKDDYLNIYYVNTSPKNYTYQYGLESIVCWGYTDRVLTHELGHFFGLYHVHQNGCNNGNCDTDGDRVCDTPPSNTSGNPIPVCPPSPVNTCSSDSQDSDSRNPYRSTALGGLGDVNDVLENYMYTSLACVDAFTQGQVDRMRIVLTGAAFDPLRSPYTLLESTKCGPVSPIVRQANVGNQLCTSTGIYQQGITFVYSNPPASGQLSVNGQLFDFSQDGIQSIDLKNLPADGNPVNVTVFFTADPSSVFTYPALFTAPTLGNCQVAPCSITNIVLTDGPTCDPVRNSYTANFQVFYENSPPGTGAMLDLYINDVLASSFLSFHSPEYFAVFLPADGQPVDVRAEFREQPTCARTEQAMYTAPNPGCGMADNCAITDLSASVGGQTACVPNTNLYTQQVTVTYSDPPASGTLVVNGQSFAITSSPQTVTLTNLISDGNNVHVTAYFSDNNNCTYTENNLFTAPENCEPQPCSITDLSIPGNGQTACDPNSNTYTQQVTVTYANAPATGNLVVNGQYFAITSSPQTVTLLGLSSDGNNVHVTAYFSADQSCQRTENNLFVAPVSCQCLITDISASAQSACNPNTNTYTQDITVTYTNPPATGTLVINNQFFTITSSPQTETLTGLIANGGAVNVSAYFSSSNTCALSRNNLFTAPNNCEPIPCALNSATLGAQSPCNYVNNTYTQSLTLFYDNAPSSGQLVVNGQSFSITGSPQAITLTDLVADGNPVDLNAYFTSDITCALNINNFFTAPANCERLSIDNIFLGIQSPCDPQTNTFSQEVIVHSTHPPTTGFLRVNGQNFPVGPSPQTVTLTGLPSNGNEIIVHVEFTDDLSYTASTDGLMAPFSCTDCTDLVNTSSIAIPATGSSNHVIQSVINMPVFGSLLEVEILDLDITHSYVGDLVVQLTSPEGSTVTLFDQPGVPNSTYGCGSENIQDLRFDDDFSNSSSVLENMCNATSPALTGSFRPLNYQQNALSNFEGEDPQGDWTLTVIDKYPASDGGSLDRWELRLCFTDAQCEIIDLAAGVQSPCQPFDNSYSQDIVVTYANPPASGQLNVNGQFFAITGSPQSVILDNLISDGNSVDVTAFFTSENGCALTETNVFTAPENCEPCSVNSIALGAQSGCDPLTNTYSQTLIVSYSKGPASGTLIINGQHFPITGSPQTVVLTGLSADDQFLNVLPGFSDEPNCIWNGITLIDAPASCAGSGDCNTLAAEQLPMAIPESNPGNIIISSTIQVGATGTISDVDILNLDIDHTWVGDLYVRLISPQGTSVDLFNQMGTPGDAYGCQGDNLSVSFDDDAFQTATDLHNRCEISPAASGRFQPAGSLSAFNGESPSGIWTLQIHDLYPGSDGGTLKNWSLSICTGPGDGCRTTGTLQLNSIPIDPRVYNATDISARGSIISHLNEDNAFFRSQNSVILQPQFEVESGAQLDIRIDPCICERSQFAVSATASSFWQGGGPIANSWFPSQAVGTPDVRICADSAKAWAPQTDGDIDEFLHLAYATPVKATGIRIWETWNDVNDGNGFVTKIEAVDLNNVTHVIWQGQDDTPCGDIFEPNITPTDFFIDEIIIHTKRLGYEQIDAVELIGVECDP